MKRNIFQKQDDSEIPEPGVPAREPETKAESIVEPPQDQTYTDRSADIINLVNIFFINASKKSLVKRKKEK